MRKVKRMIKRLSLAGLGICLGLFVNAQLPPTGCTTFGACSDAQCTGTDCSTIELKCKFGGTQVSQNYVSKSCCSSPPANPRHPWYCCETKNYMYICNNGGGLVCDGMQTFVRKDCARNNLLPYCPLSGTGCSGQPDPEP